MSDRQPVALERCDLCGVELEDTHDHLLEPGRHALRCACAACSVLAGAVGARWRRVRPRATRLPEFVMSEERWDALGVPIGLAFFVSSTAAGRIVAFYPGPAGVTESQLPLDAWPAVVADNPVLVDLEPDVEALLVNRARGARDHYRVSVDECYRLAGLVRLHWRGFTGGPALWQEIGQFFARLGTAP
jgi:hypothetical protein